MKHLLKLETGIMSDKLSYLRLNFDICEKLSKLTDILGLAFIIKKKSSSNIIRACIFEHRIVISVDFCFILFSLSYYHFLVNNIAKKVLPHAPI